MIQLNKTLPTKKELTRFAILMAVFISLLFGLILPYIAGNTIPFWPFVISLCFLVSGMIVPGVLKPVYRIWIFVGSIIGLINFYIIMTLIYVCIFSPVALVFKLLGKDPMKRNFKSESDSYRIPSEVKPKTHMERPY